MSRRFLALDQSLSSTGFALWDEGDDLPRSGAWPLCDGVHNRAMAFVGLHREIGTIHREKPISMLTYEQPIMVGTDKVAKLIGLYGLAAHVESLSYIKGIGLHHPPLSRSWRATFIGRELIKGARSDALKRLAIERCRDFGMDPLTDDEAEAIGILDHMLHQLGIMPPWRAAQPFLPT